MGASYVDIILFWFIGATLTGWGIYDLMDYQRTGSKVKLRHSVISLVLGILLLAGSYLL